MKAEIKARWVGDLRSGEFEQGTYALRQQDERGGKDKFCCLGVLCEQAVKAGVIPAPELRMGVYRYPDDRYDNEGARNGEEFREADTLPRKVMEWAGLDSDNPPIADDMLASGANDEARYSFAEIADMIEQYIPVTE